MLQTDLLELDRECQVFGRFLIKKVPDAYVLEKYRSAHRVARNVNSGKVTEFDRILLRMGTLQPWMARIVDGQLVHLVL